VREWIELNFRSGNTNSDRREPLRILAALFIIMSRTDDSRHYSTFIAKQLNIYELRIQHV
jgi:hypothetical protein